MAGDASNVSLIDESACQAFEAAWRGGQRQPIERFLPAAGGPRYQPTLEELIHIELELAWKSWGQPNPASDDTPLRPPRVEDYLARFDLAGDSAALRRLLEQEYRVRQRHGDQPSSAEYAERFPAVVRNGEELIVTSPEVDATGHEAVAPARPSQNWQPGRAIDRYQLEAEHARGGMGIIWRAQDRGLGREVALKQLKADLRGDPRTRERFIAEARLTAQLEHPGIVPVYDIGHLEGAEPYYTMKLVRGRTLSEEIGRLHEESAGSDRRAVEQVRLLNAFLTFTRAMAYAHSRGVIHRDLKPDNIILGDYGETLILDWGLAKVLAHAAVESSSAPALGDLEATQRGVVLGTPVYMSPEQASGQIDQLDARSDVYALGAILYQLLTSRRPFEARTFPDLQRQILAGRITPPRTLQPSIAPALQAICLKAMARRPEDRYARAADLADEVERHLADEPVQAYPEPLLQRGARWARRHRVLVTSSAVALLLLTLSSLGGLALWDRLEQQRQQEAFIHLTNLRSAAEADASLARAETQAGRFASAVKILDQAIVRIQNQEELGDLRQRLAAQRDRAFRVADFYRLLNKTWHLNFREQDLLAVAAAESGLTVLGIFESPKWWQSLPADDMTAAQREQLRQDAYEMFHLLAATRTKLGLVNFGRDEAKPHYRAALALVERIQAFETSQTIRLIEVISRAMLGEMDQVKPLTRGEATHPTDQFFLGLIHFFVGVLPDNFLVKALFNPVTRHVPALDMKDPKGTGKRLLQSAITQQPSHYGYYIWLGMALLAERDFASAELAFSAAVAVRPDEYWTYGFRAIAVVMQVRTATDAEQRRVLARRALQSLDKGIELDPGEAMNYWFKADMHGWLGQRAEALEAISRYFETMRPLELAADWPDSSGLFGGGLTAQRQNIQGAIQYVDQVLKANPEDIAAWQALALGRLVEAKWDEALTAAEKDAQSSRALAVRGAVRRQRGEQDLALADFTAALKVEPSNHLAGAGRAAILEQRRQSAEALAGYDQVVQHARADWQRLVGQLGRARMLAALGRPAEARQALEQAHTIHFRLADKQQAELFP